MRCLRIFWAIVCAWSFVLVAPAVADDSADTLNAEVMRLYGEGKYAEAIPTAPRA